MGKKENRLNEFCIVGKLEPYREILQIVFDKIDEANCNISNREDGGPAVHVFPDLNGKCHIRIPLKDYSSNPIEAIWVILHEFGHHKSGSINQRDLSNNVKMRREIEAWDYAKEELLLYPKLSENIFEFNKYVSKCLETYRVGLSIG